MQLFAARGVIWVSNFRVLVVFSFFSHSHFLKKTCKLNMMQFSEFFLEKETPFSKVRPIEIYR